MIGLSDSNVADVLKVYRIVMVSQDRAVILHSGIAGQTTNAMPRVSAVRRGVRCVMCGMSVQESVRQVVLAPK